MTMVRCNTDTAVIQTLSDSTKGLAYDDDIQSDIVYILKKKKKKKKKIKKKKEKKVNKN